MLNSAHFIYLHLPIFFQTVVLIFQCIAFSNGKENKRSSNSEPPYPWTFDNDLFGGPDFWGLVSKEWRMCRIGRMQSPVNIDPRRLLYDPHLTKLSIARNSIEVLFRNTGQFPLISTLEQNNTSHSSQTFSEDNPKSNHLSVVNISGGPAFPYTYYLHQAILHFGSISQNRTQTHHSFVEDQRQLFGSEHTIDQIRFPAEIQLIAYNSDLYENFTQAMNQPKGLLAISIIIDIGESSNSELKRLAIASQSITFKNRETRIKKFHPSHLLSRTEHYVTYEGSLTYPGCYETVTWIVMNNPIYIAKEDLNLLNELQQREEKESQQQPLFMAGNYRPLKPLNGRLLRTNINVKYKSRTTSGSCPSNIYLDMGYRSNPQRLALLNNKHYSNITKKTHRKREAVDCLETDYKNEKFLNIGCKNNLDTKF